MSRRQARFLLVLRLLTTAVLVGGAYEFTRFYLWSIGLLRMTESSARRDWVLLIGECKGRTALDCASGLVDQSLATAMGFAGVAAAVLPVLWFVENRWELGSAFVAALAGLIGLLSVHTVPGKGWQILVVLSALAFSVLINFFGRAVDRLKARAAGIIARGCASEAQASVNAWAAAKIVIPPAVLHLTLPVIGALALIVLLVLHL